MFEFDPIVNVVAVVFLADTADMLPDFSATIPIHS